MKKYKKVCVTCLCHGQLFSEVDHFAVHLLHLQHLLLQTLKQVPVAIKLHHGGRENKNKRFQNQGKVHQNEHEHAYVMHKSTVMQSLNVAA